MTTATQSEFAVAIGKDKSYVTRLKQKGLLVMTDAGLVDVEASMKSIEDAADPARSKTQQGGGKGSGSSVSYNEARARNEHAKAQKAELELAVMQGKLVEAEEARIFAADLAASFRVADEQSIDVLVATLQLDEAGRAVLVEEFEHKHNNLADKIAKWGQV